MRDHLPNGNRGIAQSRLPVVRLLGVESGRVAEVGHAPRKVRREKVRVFRHEVGEGGVKVGAVIDKGWRRMGREGRMGRGGRQKKGEGRGRKEAEEGMERDEVEKGLERLRKGWRWMGEGGERGRGTEVKVRKGGGKEEERRRRSGEKARRGGGKEEEISAGPVKSGE